VIAPLRNPAPSSPSPAGRPLREARRAVATLLFDKFPKLVEPPLPLMRAWKAWLAACWAVLVLVLYAWLNRSS
jgi:hypothetical protein